MPRDITGSADHGISLTHGELYKDAILMPMMATDTMCEITSTAPERSAGLRITMRINDKITILYYAYTSRYYRHS